MQTIQSKTDGKLYVLEKTDIKSIFTNDEDKKVIKLKLPNNYRIYTISAMEEPKQTKVLEENKKINGEVKEDQKVEEEAIEHEETKKKNAPLSSLYEAHEKIQTEESNLNDQQEETEEPKETEKQKQEKLQNKLESLYDELNRKKSTKFTFELIQKLTQGITISTEEPELKKFLVMALDIILDYMIDIEAGKADNRIFKTPQFMKLMLRLYRCGEHLKPHEFEFVRNCLHALCAASKDITVLHMKATFNAYVQQACKPNSIYVNFEKMQGSNESNESDEDDEDNEADKNLQD